MTKLQITALVAIRRPSSGWRAPSRRATRAPTAIISPTLIEVAMKTRIVASPTPAVSVASPSHEI